MHSRRKICRSGLLAIVLAAFVGAAAHAQQTYPQKPVTLISDAAPGSGADVGTRIIAEALSEAWGQQVVVLNRPGANGSIAARAAADAPADGYTLFMAALSTFVASPKVAPNLPVRLPRDFLPVAFAVDQPMFIAANALLGVSTLPQLIELAKKSPGKISIALTGVGRLSHLTGELIQMRAGIRLVPIPYSRGLGSALGDVTSGRVAVLIENYAGIAGAARTGHVKLIAVGSSKRLPDFPDLPTISETLPGVSASGWLVVVAPVGTPADIVAKINADFNKVVSNPNLKNKLAIFGSYTRPMTPDELLSFVKEEQEKWSPVLQRISTN